MLRSDAQMAVIAILVMLEMQRTQRGSRRLGSHLQNLWFVLVVSVLVERPQLGLHWRNHRRALCRSAVVKLAVYTEPPPFDLHMSTSISHAHWAHQAALSV